MVSKIILGLIMGFLSGSSAKAAIVASDNPALAPHDRSWFDLSARLTPLIAVIWIIYTFGAYSPKYGFMAIGEVIVGAIIAGLISHESRVMVTGFALPASIIAWIVL